MTIRHLTLVVSLNLSGGPPMALSLPTNRHSINKHRGLAPVPAAVLTLSLSILVSVIFYLVRIADWPAVNRLVAHLTQLLKPLHIYLDTNYTLTRFYSPYYRLSPIFSLLMQLFKRACLSASTCYILLERIRLMKYALQ